MLIKLKVKEYTTFMKETCFDFTATNYKILEETNVGDNRILKGAIFTGENASGKTQVLEAIDLLLKLLFLDMEIDFSEKKSLYTKGNKYSLEYVFNIENNIIKYYIEFEGNSIRSEKLYLNDELKLDRLKESGDTYFGQKKSIDSINLALPLLKFEYYNTRFNNDYILNTWFDFLKNSIYINLIYKNIQLYTINNIHEKFIEKYLENHNETKLNKFINKLGYNSEIIFNRESKDNKIELRKKGTNVSIPLDNESNGNNAFINIILPLIFATKNNCMLIVDEFSSGLHNELEEALIKFFFNNSKNSQIFFTSHSTNLLDNTILRPDQIYSFKFDPNEGTLIKRFSDENPRESQNLEKMYLSGVFDGMPSYNKKFKN